ncbi:MAG: hypothetical protein F6J90_30290 [Moorea sp. SIOASIH]|uniref:hypothetical protein n=1 Tax=Moorena sp. SIOASIH TaxID=2607817 RepID=UPI0013B9A39D|nr:hypothetical protein [Moorena sp. SIOASIH]NEO40400.1 hypothetical protein [Moorena sp. SIOASIH]
MRYEHAMRTAVSYQPSAYFIQKHRVEIDPSWQQCDRITGSEARPYHHPAQT